ncbi:uncharacterized protein LOC141614072 [Silene latifolia]|uniref:uncharacterized protein LOC141614072 n=1 Tax=Silene latifolia TaxID=37657 RepID=UPI003D7861F0
MVRITKDDVAREISFWSTAVVCYVLGANLPSSVLTGFVRRVWQAQGVDKILFMPNKWTPEMKLIKHDVKRIPIWMKIYGLDVKYWGMGCLKKLCEVVGKFICCDEATLHKKFLGFARIMIEVDIGQAFPETINFQDENGETQTLKIVYDWLPLSCRACKGLGHLAENCRKEKRTQKEASPEIALTPVMVTKTPVVENSIPRSYLTKLLRNENGGRRSFTSGGYLSWRTYPTLCRSPYWCIHTFVTDKARKTKFWFTVVYGLNKAAEREPLWITNAELRPLLQVVQDCKFADMRARGAFFTWTNKDEVGTKIYSRIDRMLVNDKWTINFPTSYVHYLPEGMFDHCPALVKLEEEPCGRRAPFKYFNMWSLSPDYDNIIRNGWQRQVQGTAMFQVVKKLKALKYDLKKLNKSQFANIENLTHVAEISLKKFQEMLN